MTRIRKYVKATSGTPEKFMSALQGRIDELESGDVMMSEDIMDGNIMDEEVIGEDVVEEAQIFDNYADFINWYRENIDDTMEDEQIAMDTQSLQIALDEYDALVDECPVEYSAELELPIITINGEPFVIDYFEEGVQLTPQSEYEMDEDIVEEDIYEEVTSSYKIEDSYGAPQAGVDVKEFSEYYELEEYLDENPDVADRIAEGYARIVESSTTVEASDEYETVHTDEEARDLLIKLGINTEALELAEYLTGANMDTYDKIAQVVHGVGIEDLFNEM